MRRILGIVSLAAMLAVFAASCGKHLPTQSTGRGETAGLSTVSLGLGTLSIGNFVWNDLNGNGLQDPGEPGVAGVYVYLTYENGDFITEKITNANGFYEFTNLSPATYKVGIKNECPLTKIGAGDPARDANPVPSTVVLTQNDATIDFGMTGGDCGPPQGECAECEGKVNALTLRYNGTDGATIRVTQKKYKNDVFNGFVAPGGLFSFVGHDKKGTLGTEIQIYVNGALNTRIHTSCSQPIGPGQIAGMFEIIAGTSLKGGELCPLPPQPPGGGSLCEDGRPRALVFTYTGEDCSASSHQQADGKVICSGDPGFASPVHIVITDSATPGAGNVYFNGDVAMNGQFTMDAANFGGTKLSTNSYAYIYSGSTLLQKVQFHTSCSQPLLVGDQYGSLQLDGFINNAISSGPQKMDAN